MTVPKPPCIRRISVMRTPCVFGLAAMLIAPLWNRSSGQEKEKSDAKTQRVELASDLIAQAPVAWKAQKPDKPFRTHEFVLPSSEKGQADGFLMVTHFGKNGGGGLEANLTRWYRLVEQP